MSLLKAGKYIARTFVPEGVKSLSGIVVYETTKGALCARIPCRVVKGLPPNDGEGIGVEMTFTTTLFKDDGTPMENNQDTLVRIFNWDRSLKYFAVNDLTGIEFEIVAKDEQGVDKTGNLMVDPSSGAPVMFSRIAWINPLGGSAVRMPEEADLDKLQAKYGSLLRALGGGVPAKRPGAQIKAPPPMPPLKTVSEPAPAEPEGPTATMEDAWDAFQDANPKMPQAELTDLWYATLKKRFGTDNNSTITPRQWGKLVAEFDNVPI